MNRNQIWIAGATLALALGVFPQDARANVNIKVTYNTFDNAGTDCVAPGAVIEKKSPRITSLKQDIIWNLKRKKGNDAAGTWVIRHEEGGSIELCPESLTFTNGTATCSIGDSLAWAYNLTWSKAGCDDVIADPVVIFDGGSGTQPMKSGAFGAILGLSLGLGLGFVLARRRLGAS